MKTQVSGDWTNRETRSVAKWIQEDALNYRRWCEAAKEARQEAPRSRQVTEGRWTAEMASVLLLADWLKEEIHDAAPKEEPSFYGELLDEALAKVDWKQIAEHLLRLVTKADTRRTDDPAAEE